MFDVVDTEKHFDRSRMMLKAKTAGRVLNVLWQGLLNDTVFRDCGRLGHNPEYSITKAELGHVSSLIHCTNAKKNPEFTGADSPGCVLLEATMNFTRPSFDLKLYAD